MDIRRVKRYDTNIDKIMDEKGIKNDSDLANQLGFSQQQLSRRLSKKITMDTLERLAAFFGCSVKDLLK